jgi:hypothetical protein
MNKKLIYIGLDVDDTQYHGEQGFHHLNHQPRGDDVRGPYAKDVSALEFIE